MKRVLVLVEGQTEERFVKDTLTPHLIAFQKALIPTIVTTKRIVSGPNFKGGGDFMKMEGDIKRLLADTNAVAVTTFYDYYGFPRNFPPRAALPPNPGAAGADQLQQALAAHFKQPNFKPYIHLHEFEAFLFVNAGVTASNLFLPEIAPKISAIRNAVNSAEEINDGPQTAPSKRIKSLAANYQKTLHGPAIAGSVGLVALRADCPRFDGWVNWLEAL
jgi:hypothetical protein